MNSINEQINLQFDKVANLLSNTNEFKNNFCFLSISDKGIIFSDLNFNNHFLISKKNKKNLLSYDLESIKLIKQF
jgi:hypothetical protein